MSVARMIVLLIQLTAVQMVVAVHIQAVQAVQVAGLQEQLPSCRKIPASTDALKIHGGRRPRCTDAPTEVKSPLNVHSMETSPCRPRPDLLVTGVKALQSRHVTLCGSHVIRNVRSRVTSA
jgi:hypothetical protein